MTSAQNHPQPSSGNNYIYHTLLLFSAWFGCSQKIQPSLMQSHPSETQVFQKDTFKPDQKIILPVDTLHWIDVSEKNLSIREPLEKITPGKELAGNLTNVFKENYNIQLFIPLNSLQYSSNALSENRFLQFYSGVLLALEDLEKEGASLRIKVEDTGIKNYNIYNTWPFIKNDEIDAIIGPFERDDLKFITSEAALKKVMVISPWQTSTKITTQNPYYIQLKPNLKEHFKRMVEHACTNYSPDQVMIVTHEGQEGQSWYNYMNEVCSVYLGTNENLRHFTVHEDSLISPNTAFVNVFKNNPPQAIILPYYSFNDEQKLYEVVRRLIVDKNNSKVTLYTMPLFLESDKIDFEFYNSFITRVAISDFVDENSYNVRQFKRKYYELFGEICGPDALKGYDVMMFTGKNLFQHGTNFQSSVTGTKLKYLQTQIELQETKGETNANNEVNSFDFYENKHISIIEFKTSGFDIID